LNDQKKPTSSMSKTSRVPAALGSGLDAEIDRIIDQAQAQGLHLTGQGGLLGGMIKKAVESAMNAEMTAHLGYERYAAEGRGSGNSRNGTSTSTVHTNAGPVELDKPRDRNGSFDSKVVPKGTRRLTEFDDMVLSLFAKGMTTRDIAEHLEITYGADVSHETIANITDAINDTVKEWRNRPLEEVYPVLYIDAIRLRIRDGGQVKIKACHLVVGVDLEGRKRVLGMWIEATEGAKFWAGVLTELRNRGVRDVKRPRFSAAPIRVPALG
jgi:putative transposase